MAERIWRPSILCSSESLKARDTGWMGTVGNSTRLDLCVEPEDPSLGLKGVFRPRNLVHLQELNPSKRWVWGHCYARPALCLSLHHTDVSRHRSWRCGIRAFVGRGGVKTNIFWRSQTQNSRGSRLSSGNISFPRSPSTHTNTWKNRRHRAMGVAKQVKLALRVVRSQGDGKRWPLPGYISASPWVSLESLG